MSELPSYLWVMTFAGVAGVVAATCLVLSRGALRAGLNRRRRIRLASAAVVLLGGWLVASTIVAAGDGYRARLGQQVPWMPIAVVALLGAFLLLARIPSLRRSLTAPGMMSSIRYPHSFRVLGGTAFLVAMALGYLPALFALPAGFGDIAVGIGSLFVARKVAGSAGRRAAVWFDSLGIADLIVALVLGGLVGFQLIPGMAPAPALSELPLVLIATVAVPILLALHISALTHRSLIPEGMTERGAAAHPQAVV